MATQKHGKLNWLEKHLPEGLVVDSAWLTEHGYSTSLRSQYVTAGWLEQPARRLYRRARGSLTWQQIVISLQTILEFPLVVGGRSALELQGYAHYLPHTVKEIHLYGPRRPPGWLSTLKFETSFVYHNSRKLFRNDPMTRGLTNLNWNLERNRGRCTDPIHGSWIVQPWGQWDWPLTLSTPERAILELLDELPAHESFHQADMLMEGLVNLSPNRLQKLLAGCHSIKVKRLFFFLR